MDVNANSSAKDGIPEYKVSECLAVLHMLDLAYTFSTRFVCQLCHTFMVDICTFPCGHMFCKYCAIHSLHQDSHCPQCQQETYKPFSARCYEMDSLIDEFYPVLWSFYQKLGGSGEASGQLVTMVSSATLENNELEWPASANKVSLRMHPPAHRDNVRKRRRLITERRDILLEAPCTSILQKLGTLGWGTGADEQSLHGGMQVLVWLALCYALWNFIYVFQHPCFDGGWRSLIYAVVLLVAFNVLQMHLFVHPESAPNLLDFELWEWYQPETSNTVINDAIGHNSYHSCQDEEGTVHQSILELEQTLEWRKQGSLDLEDMFKIANELTDLMGQVRSM